MSATRATRISSERLSRPWYTRERESRLACITGVPPGWDLLSRPATAESIGGRASLLQDPARNRYAQSCERGVVGVDEQQAIVGTGSYSVRMERDCRLIPVALGSAFPF